MNLQAKRQLGFRPAFGGDCVLSPPLVFMVIFMFMFMFIFMTDALPVCMAERPFFCRIFYFLIFFLLL